MLSGRWRPTFVVVTESASDSESLCRWQSCRWMRFWRPLAWRSWRSEFVWAHGDPFVDMFECCCFLQKTSSLHICSHCSRQNSEADQSWRHRYAPSVKEIEFTHFRLRKRDWNPAFHIMCKAQILANICTTAGYMGQSGRVIYRPVSAHRTKIGNIRKGLPASCEHHGLDWIWGKSMSVWIFSKGQHRSAPFLIRFDQVCSLDRPLETRRQLANCSLLQSRLEDQFYWQ